MRNRIRLLLLFFSALLCLSACRGRKPEGKKKVRIGVSVYDGYDTFISELTTAFREAAAAEARSVQIELSDAGRSQEVQDKAVRQMLDNGCDIICVNLVDRTAPGKIIDMAKKKNVPIIFFNRELVEEDLERWDKLYYVGADAKESGVLQGELAAAYLKAHPEADRNQDGVIQYVVLEGEAGHQDAILRTEYAASTLKLHILPNTFLVVTLGATTVAAMAWRLPRGSHGFVKDAAASLFTIAYLPLLGCFVPLMMGDDGGSRRIATWILSVVASDTGGYAVGVLCGKHKLAPRISPKKSWEGFAGSVITAAFVGWACLGGLLSAPWWAGIVLGVVLALTGTAGDLVESMIKRDAGIKDMSNFLPGHGGVMDRLDSVLFSAPFAWLVMSLVL